MYGGVIRKAGLALALVASGLSAPATAQYSDAYNFLKAVKDRDGTKVTEFLNEPGSTLIRSSEQSTGETALHIVVQRRDATWTKFLLDRGADPNKADKRGTTPLAMAANLGFIEGVEMLLKRGARVDGINSAGETPLISAVHRRDIAMVRLLLKNGASLDKTDNSGRSAREYARLMGSAAGIAGEIERVEAERKGKSAQVTYGPGL